MIRATVCLTFLYLSFATALAAQDGPVLPEESLELLHTNSDVRVELVASEPLVFDPVALAFDERGRMFIVENRGYPTGPEEGKPPAGDVAMLEDIDGDGRFEKRTIFADELDFPNGVMAWRDGILVTCAPHVYHYRDTDGDGRADSREDFLQGFSLGGSTQLRVSHPTLAVDNWIYFTNGLSGGDVSTPGKPDAIITMGGSDLRFNPITLALETTAGQAQFGLAFDDSGQKFVCSNRKHIQHIVMQPADLARNVHLGATNTVADIPDHGEAARLYGISEGKTTAYSHAGTFTAACGLVVYRGSTLPFQYCGNAFVCDPTANIVHRDVLEQSGATFTAKRPEEGIEFLASKDNWFRPVFLANGPEGALYICDMYRKSIEHPVYLPPDVAAITDFEAGKDMGRIYRVVGKESKAPSAAVVGARMSKLSLDENVARLDSADSWIRETAQRLLLERSDPAAPPLLRKIARESSSPTAKVHALHLLNAHNALTEEDIVAALADSSPRVREHATRLARGIPGAPQPVVDSLIGLASDADSRVRFECVLALGDIADKRVPSTLASIAVRDIADPWMQSAILGSAHACMSEFASAFTAHLPVASPALNNMLELLGRTVAAGESADVTARLVQTSLSVPGSVSDNWRIALVCGVADGIIHGQQFPAASSSIARLYAKEALLKSPVDDLLATCRERALDTSSTIAEKAWAVKLLGYSDFDATGALLESMLSPQTPQELQIAAVKALSNMSDDRVGAALVSGDRWIMYGPAVRTVAAGAVLARPARCSALLDAVEGGKISPTSIDPVTRNQLQHHAEEIIKKRAELLLAKADPRDRKKVYEEYKAILTMKPSVESGKVVFQNICSTCHVFQAEGHVVGPDLTGIRSQPVESILLHIVNPNGEVVPGYENYIVDTSAGESISGIIASQTESSITIRGPLGVEKTIQRSDIERLMCPSLSLMPEELEKSMTKQEFRDLIGYLKGE